MVSNKTRNSGQWTEARWVSFVKSALRSASRKWGPINETKKEARVGYGKYKCASCKKIVGPTKKVGNKRQQNIFVDHIRPVIGKEGFTTWDEFVNNLFCERDNLQLLCKDCHDKKSEVEKIERKNNNGKL